MAADSTNLCRWPTVHTKRLSTQPAKSVNKPYSKHTLSGRVASPHRFPGYRLPGFCLMTNSFSVTNPLSTSPTHSVFEQVSDSASWPTTDSIFTAVFAGTDHAAAGGGIGVDTLAWRDHPDLLLPAHPSNYPSRQKAQTRTYLVCAISCSSSCYKIPW